MLNILKRDHAYWVAFAWENKRDKSEVPENARNGFGLMFMGIRKDNLKAPGLEDIHGLTHHLAKEVASTNKVSEKDINVFITGIWRGTAPEGQRGGINFKAHVPYMIGGFFIAVLVWGGFVAPFIEIAKHSLGF